MTAEKNDIIRKTGLTISLIAFVGSVTMFTQIVPGSIGRTATLMVAITSIFAGISFFLQLKQNRKSH
jgi:hypothetical protein